MEHTQHQLFSSLAIERFCFFFSIIRSSLQSQVIQGRPVIAPGSGWVCPNWPKPVIGFQFPNLWVWIWTYVTILANETNGGSAKDFLSIEKESCVSGDSICIPCLKMIQPSGYELRAKPNTKVGSIERWRKPESLMILLTCWFKKHKSLLESTYL